MIEDRVLNAGLYIRVSTERQVKEGYSVAAQKDKLSKFAKQQRWKIFDIYADEGISGKDFEGRPEVKRLIEDIKQKRVDVVVLYKFDRLTRDSKDTESVIDLIQQFGVQVFTLSGGSVDVSSASSRFAIRINGAVAQLEREQTIERIKFAFEQKVRQGYTLACNTTCYGYNRKVHEKEQTINQAEACVVKRIFKMYLAGRTFTEISDVLNAEKIPTKMAGRVRKIRGTDENYTINSVWQPKTVRLILSNPTYIGKVRYHMNEEDGFITEGQHKPIISQKQWDEVQIKLSKIKRTYRTNLPKEDVYYCGTLVCGVCGHRLTTNRTNRIKKDGSKVRFNGYRCVNKEKKLCTCLGVSHKKVEDAFLMYMDTIEELTEIDKVEIEGDNEELEELDGLKKSLLQLTTKHHEIQNLFIDSKITLDQLQYMTSEITKKSDSISKEIARLERVLEPKRIIDKSEIAKTVKEHWQYLSNRERLEFLNNFVEEIVIVNRDRDKINGKPEIISVKFYDE